jgi:cobalt-zinc-cadmium efflux system membrane fusion protein
MKRFITQPLLLALLLLLAACGGAGQAPGHEHADAQAREPASERGEPHANGAQGHDESQPDPSVRIAAAIAGQSGIRSAAVGAGEIADEHEVQGLLTPIEGRLARVAARFPGPVRSLHARVGDRVRAGQVLAQVESNLSLSRYAITAPISGVVMGRTAAEGDVVGEGAVLFEVADLSRLWVDLHVFGADASHIGIGSPVLVTRLGDGVSSASVIERILPATATASQSTVARAVLANADGLWRPGTAVRARITVDRAKVPLAIPLAALQEMDGREVVFVRSGEEYHARAVTLGRRDAQRAEVLSGLRAGEQVVVEQSYVIKADLEKSGAAHEH